MAGAAFPPKADKWRKSIKGRAGLVVRPASDLFRGEAIEHLFCIRRPHHQVQEVASRTWFERRLIFSTNREIAAKPQAKPCKHQGSRIDSFGMFLSSLPSPDALFCCSLIFPRTLLCCMPLCTTLFIITISPSDLLWRIYSSADICAGMERYSSRLVSVNS